MSPYHAERLRLQAIQETPLTAEQKALIDDYRTRHKKPLAVAVKLCPHRVSFLLTRGLDEDDLSQHCWFGVMKAARSYDPSKGASFDTYASWKIRGEMARLATHYKFQCRYPTRPVFGLPPQITAPNVDEDVTLDFGKVEAVMATLKPRTQAVLRMKFGLDGESHTLTTIGNRIGRTRERARQIIDRGIAQLRKRLAS